MPYIGNDIQFGELTSQSFTGDGSTTAFTLSYTVANPTSLIVTIGNVIQEPTTAYTVAGTTLTCTSAPASGDTIHVRFLGRVVDVANAAILQDSDQDTKIQVEESADEDTIRFDLAGAEDFTMSANSLNVLTGSVIALPDATVGAPALTNTGDVNTGIYFPAADTVGVVTGGVEQFRFGSNSVSPGSKNLIENGGMNVSQRGTLTGQGGSSNVYTAIDRWLFRAEGVGQARVSTSKSSLSVANALLTQGCRNAIEIDCTTAESSVAAGECLVLAQKMEAQNLQHLLFGTSGAKDLTLSFAMRSPKSGTHCVSILQGDANRSYIAEFTIASADTLEHFSMTIPGDTSGTINNDVGSGMRLHFPLTAGTNFHNTAGSWFSGEDYATSNQQNLLDNTANNIYISAVQLEVGGVFTGFEFEDYGTTLLKCQRVLQLCGNGAVGGGRTANVAYFGLQFFPVMRAVPSLTLLDDSVNVIDTAGAGLVSASGSIQISNIKATGLMFGIDGYSGGNVLTQHRPHIIYNQADFLLASAEL